MSVRRFNAITGESIQLYFSPGYSDAGTAFDPFLIQEVDILAIDGVTKLEVIPTANIVRQSLGVYYILTNPNWNINPTTIFDKWIYYKVNGGQQYESQGNCTIDAAISPSPTPIGLPSPTDCRNFLEGYQINSSIISDTWIQDDINNAIVPFVQDQARTNLTEVMTATEYLSGISWDYIMLGRRDPTMVLTSVQLVSGEDVSGTINLGDLQLIPEQGIIKVKSGLSEYYEYRTFPKGNLNIKVQYTYGGSPSPELMRSVKLLECVNMLTLLEGRTGGGDLTVQQFSKSYGNMGKYTNIRKQLYKQALYIIRKYGTIVIGS